MDDPRPRAGEAASDAAAAPGSGDGVAGDPASPEAVSTEVNANRDASARPLAETTPAISTQGLTKRFGKVTALRGLDLRVEPGEVFGFLGPNGAGKSTTIRLLLGFLHPTAGRASILGLDTVSQSLAIRRRIGYLPGGVSFDDTVSGERALDDLAALQHASTDRRSELCERLQLPAETLHRRVRDYSRGTRQKLGIVQALQHDPEVVILDEPTEGLDPLVQHAFFAVLENLRAAGRTVFFSSHVLSDVERVCDRVAIIRAGGLVATESVRDLLDRRRRSVEMRFSGRPPDLSAVPGVSMVEAHEGLVTCRIAGSVAPFLTVLAGTSIVDLVIQPAHLEDVFLEFYSPGDIGDGRR